MIKAYLYPRYLDIKTGTKRHVNENDKVITTSAKIPRKPFIELCKLLIPLEL